MSENNNLRKCSRCHSTKLEEYFSFNKKGELYKLCDSCRNRQGTALKKTQTEKSQYVQDKREQLMKRINLFRDSIKYFETGNKCYYNESINTFLGNELKLELAHQYTTFLNSQLKWLETCI